MPLTPGDPAPWFTARSTVNPRFVFDTIAGRYVVLCFFGSAGQPAGRRVLDDVEENRTRFDNLNATFLGVSVDPDDERLARLPTGWPGIIHFWDHDLTISRLYGAAVEAGSPAAYRPCTIVLDQALRVLAVVPFGDDPEAHVPRLCAMLDALPPVRSLAGHAPALVVPRVFEPEFCRTLVGLYEQHGGEDSGFMRDVDGRTVPILDYSHKRRRDYDITDQEVVKSAQARLVRRLVPEIRKAFQFEATRIERHIVACYDSAEQAHFRAHRDNTTKGTAHRRFAVTINLNAEQYEGGDLWFPEFGPRTYRAPTGGAVVFSCSLLHEATPVVRGRRYAFLPFLYDEQAAKIRQANVRYLGQATSPPGAADVAGAPESEDQAKGL